MPLPHGARLGPYEVTAPLGAGGMGEVYRARDTRLDRSVALKVLPAHVSGDPDRRARFEREARAIARLQHPHICTVHDVGAQDGVDYLVMELLEGETLAERLDRGPLPVAHVILQGRQIAQALERAHKAGIVHRDLKPANVMITKSGVKLLDFGLARLRGAGISESGTLTAHAVDAKPLTDAGSILGTLSYMPPEQLEGRETDARSDVWALGAVLYEMATGRKPFTGSSQASLIGSILRDEPPAIPSLQPTSPPALNRLIRTCLAKDPDERWQSAGDVAKVLDGVAEVLPAGEGRPARARLSWPLLLAVAALGTLLGAAALYTSGPRWGLLPATAPDYDYRRLTFRRGNLLHARLAPDGQTFVYAAAWEGRPAELFLGRVDSHDARPLGITAADVLAVSRSGEMAVLLKRGHLANLSGSGTLARVPLTGGAPREVLEDVKEADWSADGRELAITREAADRVRLEYPIGTVRLETRGNISSPRVSPDGARVACVVNEGGPATIEVVARDGATRTVFSAPGMVSFVWAPDGGLRVSSGRDGDASRIWAVDLSGRRRLLARLPSYLALHDIGRDGTLLVERAEQRNAVNVYTPALGREREVSWLGLSYLQGLSEDGTVVLLEERGEPGGGVATYLRSTDGAPAVRLADGEPRGLSEDGRLALVRPQERHRLVVVPRGAGETRVLELGSLLPVGGGGFHPNGRDVVFGALEDGHGLRGYLMPMAGGTPRPVTPEGITHGGALSPDGTAIVLGDHNRQSLIYPLDGSAPRPVPGMARMEIAEQWSADGRFFYVRTWGEMPARIDKLEIATGRRTRWKELMPFDAAGVVRIDQVRITRDGSSYAYGYVQVVQSDLGLLQGLR